MAGFSAGGELAGKTVLVTGATSGLGMASAEALAAKGARMILGARTCERGEDARRRVAAVAGSKQVHVVVADLSSQEAVLGMADQILESFDRLDVLVNNAGVDVGGREVTVDGLELTFAVNYMAPFLLTNRLLGLFRESSPARVLNVVSSGYRGGSIDPDNLLASRSFSGQRAYNDSKLALLVFTYELARRLVGTGITANAVDPGFVRGTGIGTTLPAGYKMLGVLMWPFMATVQRGADTTVWGASDPSLIATTGRYFKRRREISTGSPTHDEDFAERLWTASERLGR